MRWVKVHSVLACSLYHTCLSVCTFQPTVCSLHHHTET